MACPQVGKIALRESKNGIGRLSLGDDGEALRIIGPQQIARIHLPQANLPVQRGQNAGVRQLQTGIVNLRSIHRHGTLVLAHQGLLRIELLPGGGILGPQILVASEVALGVVQQGLIAGQLALGLIKLDLERLLIQLSQKIPLLHPLPFAEGHFL